jgi:Plasmid pRiA4b ORF-3-like protein
VLGKNDLYELNQMLVFKKDVTVPNYNQESYPVIDLVFKLAILGKLYVKTADAKGNIRLTSTVRKIEFDNLNNFEKFVFLFETFWCQFDFNDILRYGSSPLEEIIKKLAVSKTGNELRKGAFSKRTEHDPVFSYMSFIIHYFSFFGLFNFIPVKDQNKKLTRYDDSIDSVFPTEFGVNFCKIMKMLPFRDWNIPCRDEYGIYGFQEKKKSLSIPLTKYLEPVFPAGVLSNTVTASIDKLVKGNYIFKVSLGKKLWRKIKISHNHTLEDLHLAIQKAFNFDNDHLYSFFMDAKRYSKHAFHSPNSDDEPWTDDDEAKIGKLGLYNMQRILYLFDYGDSWEFEVQLTGINENETPVKKPQIIEKKGKAPEQYRSYYDDNEEEDEE